jgi:hypothetical protein
LSLQNLGFALLRTGRLQEGSDRLREALKTQSTRVGYQEAIVICLIGLAEAAQLAGDGHRGATLIGAAEALRDEIGSRSRTTFAATTSGSKQHSSRPLVPAILRHSEKEVGNLGSTEPLSLLWQK